MNDFDRGVQAELDRIERILRKFKVEGLEIVFVKEEPGVRTSSVRRFDTEELLLRIKEERAKNDG